MYQLSQVGSCSKYHRAVSFFFFYQQQQLVIAVFTIVLATAVGNSSFSATAVGNSSFVDKAVGKSSVYNGYDQLVLGTATK